MMMMLQPKDLSNLLLNTFFLFLISYSNDGAELAAKCNASTEYSCSNGRCISVDRLNNSVNDCGDNSDEVAYPCRAPLFSCRNHRCVIVDWVLDGRNDCIDGSDEAKLIGMRCDMVTNCCNCDEYVPHSQCDDGLCRCSDGFFSNLLGTVCHERLVGSDCLNDSDCRDTIVNSHCSTELMCTCDAGYDDTMNGSHCERRLLGHRCEKRIDCQTVEHSRCSSNSTCGCDVGYAESTDRKSCIAVLLNDTCHIDSDCLATGSVCPDGNCACPTGFYYNTTSRDACVARLLGNDCDHDDDCFSVIDDAICAAGRCACADDRLATSRDGRTQSCVVSDDARDVTVIALGIFLLGCLVVFDSFLVLWMACNFVCKPRTIAQNGKGVKVNEA